MFLKPQAFYELVNEIELMFADIKCQYLLAQAEEVVSVVLWLCSACSGRQYFLSKLQ